MPTPQAPNILKILGEVIDDEDQSRAPRTEYHHNPSSATMKLEDGRVVGACLRQLWYKAKNQPESDSKELTVKLQGLFGQAIHDAVLAKLQKSKKLSVIPEAAGKVLVDPLTSEVSFRLDGLVTYRGELGVLEIKTKQGFGLQRQIKDRGCNEDDLLQVLSYFGTNDALRWGSLVYLARDSAYRAEYHITKEEDGFYVRGILPESSKTKLDHLSFDKIRDRWKELEGFIEKDEMPKRDYKVVFTEDGRITESRIKMGYKYKSDYRCLYCSYQSQCWLNETGADEDKVHIPKNQYGK